MQTYSSPFALTNISTSADASSFTSLERLLLFEKHFGATIDSFLAPTNTIYDAVIEGKIRVSASIYEEKLMRHLALIKRNATNNMLLSINLYKAEEKTPRKQFILTNIIAKNVTTQDIARANEIQKRVQEIQKKIKLEDSKWGAREGMLSDLISLKKEARELTNAFVSTLTTNIDNLSYSLSHVIASSTPERTLLFEKGEEIYKVDHILGEIQIYYGSRIFLRSDNSATLLFYHNCAEQLLHDFKSLYALGPQPLVK